MRIRRICGLTSLGTMLLLSSEAVMEREQHPFSLGNIILLKKRGKWDSHFIDRLIRSLGVLKEKGVWFSEGGRKDKHFFPSLHSLGLYNNIVFCLRTVSGLNLLANSVNYGSRPVLWVSLVAQTSVFFSKVGGDCPQITSKSQRQQKYMGKKWKKAIW